MDADRSESKFFRLSTWEAFLSPLIVLGVLGTLTALDRSGIRPEGTRPVDIVSSLRASEAPDTTHIAALADSTEPATEVDSTKKSDSTKIIPDLSLLDTAGVIPLEGDTASLERFFAALDSGREARIAWFGDSFTEGDILVGDLRSLLQKSFGGAGIGLVPATTPIAKFRATVKQTFSSDWKERNIMEHGGPPIQLGITGRSSMPRIATDSAKASWVRIESGDRAGTRTFRRVRIFVSGGTDSTDSVHARWEGGQVSRALGTGASLRQLSLDLPEVADFKMSFATRDTLSVQALSLEDDDKGVLIDNLSIRGNSGVGILHIPAANLETMQRDLRYSLVVLQFGVNVADTNMPGYNWYRARLVEVVERIHATFPGAGVLMLGVGDRGVRDDQGRIVTHPSIPMILEAQRKAAAETGCAFWDLQQAMGGTNAMARWAAAGLVAPDFVHISSPGGRRLAKALHKSMLLAWSRRGPK